MKKGVHDLVDGESAANVQDWLRQYLSANDLVKLKSREPEAVEKVLQVICSLDKWNKVDFVLELNPGPFIKDLVVVTDGKEPACS